MSAFRLGAGGAIDRSKPLEFSFDGRRYQGLAGDTLASALLANGLRTCARSFKYHRPRGIWGYGSEEPNALVQIGPVPNLKATEIELVGGLEARAVNCWPSAAFDLGAINSLFAPFLPAGFYYKTFIWPSWTFFEWAIRRAAGLGSTSLDPDGSRYDSTFAHCDVLVVGGGGAGLAAARAASSSGARVILCDQDRALGGQLMIEDAAIDGADATDWIAQAARELHAAPETRVLTRTTAFGYFDHNSVALFERRGGGGRLWQVRANQVVLATGATERPLVFSGNDRPGVMSAAAVRHYIKRFAVRPGTRAVLFANNDLAYRTLADLVAAKIDVAAIVDTREEVGSFARTAAAEAKAPLHPGAAVVGTTGARALSEVVIRTRSGARLKLAADLLAVSGGWSPNVHLFSQSGGKLRFDATQFLFRPDVAAQKSQCVGAANGEVGLGEALRGGHEAGVRAALACGFTPSANVSVCDVESVPLQIGTRIVIEAAQKAFVDFQNDVTADDIALAARENYVSVEHLKRYTTTGMGTDQGKTSNVNALAIMGELTQRAPQEVGATTYRPPYTPIPFGAFRGFAAGDLFRPKRHLAAHDWHAENGAVFEEYGQWQRPACYPRPGESHHAAEQREARAVRTQAGLFDASPLGKIELRGPDAAEFLDRIYANTMSTLKIGRIRYGMMLNELGVVIDDGVVARLAQDHFVLSTTSSGAERIAAWLEEWLQCEWLDLDVVVTPVTTAWAAIALAGPRAPEILTRIGVDQPVGARDFPHMSFKFGAVAEIPARIFRVSFSGEISYEINVPTSQCLRIWERLIDAGASHGLVPVGIDAWMVLRVEKGYFHVGADTDGTTLPDDLGWGHVLKRQRDFIGRRSLLLPEAKRADRHQLVGLETRDPKIIPPIGAHTDRADGYVTSSALSPVLGRSVALAMIRSGRDRLGDIVTLLDSGRRIEARIVAPCAYDLEGVRLNG